MSQSKSPQWPEMGVEGWEKGGGGGWWGKLFSHTMAGGCSRCNPPLWGNRQVFCAKRSSLLQWKIAARSRVDGGVKVPIGHGQTWYCCVAGHCGKVSAYWGESRDMWDEVFFFFFWFALFSTEFDSHHRFQQLITSNCHGGNAAKWQLLVSINAILRVVLWKKTNKQNKCSIWS